MTLQEAIHTLDSMRESLEIDVPSDGGYVEKLEEIIDFLSTIIVYTSQRRLVELPFSSYRTRQKPDGTCYIQASFDSTTWSVVFEDTLHFATEEKARQYLSSQHVNVWG